MQHDEVIWSVINQNFCSYKTRTSKSTFCRNEYNVTGLCNRQSCPLANSNYATVRELDGVVYLFKKTIERAHTPAKLWEKMRLSQNLEQAQEQINSALEHWPKFLQAKCSERLVRIREYLAKMRKIELNPQNQPILTVKKGKVVKREAKREARAKKVAQLETTIEHELLERLQKGVYGDIYNLHQKAFESVLQKEGQNDELLEEEEEEVEEEDGEYEYVEETENEEFESEVEMGETELISDFVESENDEQVLADLEDLIQVPPAKTRRGGPYVEIEYENEDASSKKCLSK